MHLHLEAIFCRSFAVYASRGCLFERLGQPDKATADLQAATRAAPDNMEFLRNQGLCCRAHGDFDGCIHALSAVLLQSPGDVTALSNRGWAPIPECLTSSECLVQLT